MQYEIDRLEKELAEAQTTEEFDQRRVRKLEEREQLLEIWEKDLTKQEQLLAQQSKMIEERLQALSDLEKRYMDLLEREKELELLEQKLKQEPGYKEAKRALKR